MYQIATAPPTELSVSTRRSIKVATAFDSLKLWKALKNNINLSPAYINFLIRAYKGSSATIRTPLGNTRWIGILKGVKQGGFLSALLFCIAIGLIILL